MATYRFKVTVPVFECSLDGTVRHAATIEAPGNAQFVYIDTVQPPPGSSSLSATNSMARTVPATPATTAQPTAPFVILQFLKWTGTTTADTQKRALFNTSASGVDGARKTFCVDKKYFDGTTERTYATGWASRDLAAGILVLPIKMRSGGKGRAFDFSRDVTLGTVVGPRWRRSPTKDIYTSILVGAGITAVTLNSESTGGMVAQSTDRAAVTLTAGLLYEVNRFQIGLMTGFDKISNPNQNDWVYHGKPWMSIGLGYSLLQAPTNTPAKGQ